MVHTTAPQVFVSYEWESESHRKKVKKFVQDLRKNGGNVTWDEDLLPGERLPSFMAASISTSDYVLLICAPTYKRRADGYALEDPNTYGNPNPTGVLYECKVITAEICETCNE